MSLLEAARAYEQRGWSVIPVKADSKKPAVRWKRYQDRRAGEARLRKWFGKHGDWQVAVVTGAISGDLVIRDFDDLDTYRQWAEAHGDLSAKLPTVATPRGRHVFFRAKDLRYRKLPDGEYRGEGHYTLLPPSKHPSGAEYRWIIDLPEGELPLLDPVKAGLLPPEPEPPPAEGPAGRPGRPDRPETPWPPTGLTQRTQRFLSIGAVEGHRNAELFCAACDMASKGVSRSEAERRLLEACGRCQPPYPSRTALKTIASAYSRERWQAGRAEDPMGAYSMPRCIAQRDDLTSSDKLTWAALDYRQRDKGDCWPSLEKLGDDVGRCRATVFESVKRLEGKGMLTVKRRYGRPSLYTTHLPRSPTGPQEGASEQDAPGPVKKPDSKYHKRRVQPKEPP